VLWCLNCYAIMKILTHSIKNFLFAGAGLVCLLLGIIGIVLPLLPTTPFLLLAAACFARSSDKFHDWLITHPRLGPVIVSWQKHRCMVPKVKRMATVLILLSFTVSVYLVDYIALKVVLLVVMCGLLIFIWRTADGPDPHQL